MAMSAEQSRQFTEGLNRLRETLPPDRVAELDKAMAEAIKDQLANGARCADALRAIALLHRDGGGQRAGFCAECGQVMPCTTLKFTTVEQR